MSCSGRKPVAHLHGELIRMSSLAVAHRVILWDAVGETEGTGIVHIAPGCGAEDFQLGKEHRLPAGGAAG